MDDCKIIELFQDRSENAIKILKQKYSKIYLAIFRQLLNNSGDIEECENDLLLAIWNSIPPNKPNYLTAYVCKIARRIGINKFNHSIRQKRNNNYTVSLSELEECIPSKFNQFPSNESNLNEVLNNFIITLDEQTRVLFIRHYVYLEPIKDLSKRFDISENSISVKLFRARKKLQKELNKEGIKT